MKHRIAALALALLMTAVPALAQTAEDELDAYWAGAEPLYAQLEALGARQTEIYQEFSLSLDGEDSPVMEDDAYEEYVRGLGVLTEDELKTLMDANARIVALYEEAEEMTASYTASEDPAERSAIDKLIHVRYDEIEKATQSVAALDDRVRAAEETAYVMGLPGLTDAARQELITMYETQRSVEKQLSALEAALSDEAQEALYQEGD